MNYLKNLLQFSYTPNRLGFCGAKKPGIYALLDKDKWSSADVREVKDFLGGFKAMMAYLKAVSKACGRDLFDEAVVNAYLVGWDRWNEFDIADILKDELKAISIPEQLERINRLPHDGPFTHNFHVLYFGSVATEIPGIEKLADYCKVSLGTFIDGKTVEYNKLLPDYRIVSGRMEVKTPKFLAPEKGDRAFIHYKQVFKMAGPEDTEIYNDNFSRVLSLASSLKK